MLLLSNIKYKFIFCETKRGMNRHLGVKIVNAALKEPSKTAL